uniref:Protein ALP1-like n=1 Tax=Tanacetum cinerariifolium TaxID=118510 RepID=A0A6L2LIQ5_TANCI|nr:hypothetical protein [Tanacetum cinerariifolium]
MDPNNPNTNTYDPNNHDTTNTYDHCDVYFQDDRERYIRGAAYEQFVAMCDQEAGGSGSASKRTKTYIPRKREEAEQRLIDDYFDDDETSFKYLEENYRRREAVADQKSWIWHAYFEVPRANNGLNVLYGSPLFDDELADRALECSFIVNRHTHKKGYYLAYDIYPTCGTFVKTFSIVRDEKTLKFNRVQESSRKDIERAFEVLQGFEVNFREMLVNPQPHIQRTWIDRCDLHVRKTK